MSIRRRPNWKYEKLAWSQAELVCGVDEVGTGAWAGPVFAAAVVFKKYSRLPKLMDCKLLSPEERVIGAEAVMKCSSWAVGRAEVSEIFELGLRPATFLAMHRAISSLPLVPNKVLVDAFRIPDLYIPQENIIRGDYLVASIAAASLVAKVHRDRIMKDFDRAHPGYGFGDHKGYGTKYHQQALKNLGPSPIHRLNYSPLKKLLK